MLLRRSFLVLTVALMTGAITRPAAQVYGYCGFFWISGSGDGSNVVGWASAEYVPSWCGWVEGVQAGAGVAVSSPSGTQNSDYYEDQSGSGYAFVQTSVPLQPGEAGWAAVFGSGGVCIYYGYYCESYQDSLEFYVEGAGGCGECPPPAAAAAAAPTFSILRVRKGVHRSQ